MTVRAGSVGPPIRANTMEPEVLRQIVAGLAIAAGVIGYTDLAVTQTGTPSMGVSVGTGFALIAGTSVALTQGQYWFYNDAPVTVALTASHLTLNRIDTIVAQIQDAFYAGASNTPQLTVVTGTPAGTPVAPAIPVSSIALANVYVGAGVTSVTNGNITDVRPFANAHTRINQWLHATSISGASIAEAQVASVTIPAPGWPYRILASGSQYLTSSVATDTVVGYVRDTNLAGTAFKAARGPAGSSITWPRFKVDVPSGASKTLIMSFARLAGSGTITCYADDTLSYLDAYIVPL